MFNSKKQHTPAAMRNIGFSAVRLYILGFIASAVWVLLITFGAMHNNFLSAQNIFIKDVTDYEMIKAEIMKRSPKITPVFGFLKSKESAALFEAVGNLNIAKSDPKTTQEELERLEREHSKATEEYNIFSDKEHEELRKISHLQSEELSRLDEEYKGTYNKIKNASGDQINALRVTLLMGACIILFLYILLGHRFAIINTPSFMGKHFYIYSAPFIAAYALTFINNNGSVLSSLWLAFWLFIPPTVFMTFPVLKLVFVEYFKEHPLYRRWFVLGRGGEAARTAGIKEFSEKELPNYFESGKLKFKENSSIYLGKTLFEDDIKIGGRDVGITNEQHMATFALTGAGKSRDAVWNTLLNYSGGTLVFDPKGEHFRVTSKRRAEAAPVHLLDPYGSVSDIAKTEYWNPLSEIDINSPSARDELRNMAEASIYMDKGESGSGGFFRENAQLIYRGFLAYVLDQMPENDRHLGTVYDLMATGEPEGKFASKRSWDTLIAEMMLCDAVAGAPRDAASLLERVGERERGSYISTIVRGIDWVNSPAIREVISKPSSFSIRDAKSKEASIYLVLPEKFITPQIRFIRTFYSMAFGYCNNFETPQPKGSKRRVLFLFDEFNKLGEFRPALDAILTQRSSFLKCWFIQQNVNQLKSTYDNIDDFLSSCDKQFFGIDATDTTAVEMIEKALGSYTVTTRNDKGDIANTNETHALMSRSEIAEFLDKDQPTQIVIPLGGKPLKLKKTRYYENFNSSQYGKHDF